MRGATYEDPLPTDRQTCSRFGSGAFPCGEPYKVRVTKGSSGPRRGDRIQRRVLCEMHYKADVNKVQGGLGGLKGRAKQAAYDRLAGLHREEFQRLFEEEVARVFAEELPDVETNHHKSGEST